MSLSKIVGVITLTATLMKGGMDVAMPDKNIDGTAFLVNRQHTVTSTYVPETRKTEVNGMSQTMRNDAATALEEMFAAAKAEGVSLSTVSGYRSYSKQKTIYQRKLSKNSKAVADSLVALPGTSEHQLGLAMDLAQKGSSQLNSGFGGTKGGKWVNANAYRFGFIVRYQKGMEDITGYAYEPWHVRYVGNALAKAIFDAGVPMEIYMSAHRLEIYDFLLHQATKEVLP